MTATFSLGLLPGSRLIDIFDAVNHTLLILGAPGSGKTTLLLTLAKDLLDRATRDPAYLIPVVLPLTSWAIQRRPLAAWLVDELHQQYDVPHRVAQAWVETDQVLPLLDGLDEVMPEHQTACVEAINLYRQEHSMLPLVVCSRVVDYEALKVRLRLQGAIVIQPLTPVEVEAYLTQVGASLAGVRQALQENSALGELFNTPFMLSIVAMAYAGRPVAEQHTSETPEVRRRHLFAAYVERMLQRRSISTRYAHQQTENWLAWLAWQMGQHSQTAFYLEHMQPDWLPDRVRWIPTKGVRLVVVLLFALATGGLFGIVTGVASGLVLGLLFGVTSWVVLSRMEAINIGGIIGVEILHWSWPRSLFSLLSIFMTGIVFGLVLGLLYGLLAGLVAGLLFVVLTGLMQGLSAGTIATKTIPNQGIYRSVRNAFLVGVPSGAIIGLAGGLIAGVGIGLVTGIAGGAVLGLPYGGLACLQHFALRLVIVRSGFAPWRYAAFLDYAAERLFLRKVGGGYMFIHRQLQEYFAARHMEPGGTTDGESSRS